MDTDLSKLILIVEDDESLRKALEQKFLFEKFRVETAQDGEEGLKKTLQLQPDLIVLDIRMPKKTGWEMLHALRQTTWGKQEPVIILTNYEADDEMMAHVVNEEPSYYFVKTETDLDTLITKSRELLHMNE